MSAQPVALTVAPTVACLAIGTTGCADDRLVYTLPATSSADSCADDRLVRSPAEIMVN